MEQEQVGGLGRESRILAEAMAASYQRLTGEGFVDLGRGGGAPVEFGAGGGAAAEFESGGGIGSNDSGIDADLAERMYASDELLLCHDGATDPLFTYANLAAQRVFELKWDEFVGMPSRLSAAPDAQADRNELISRATESGFFTGYSGVRVSNSGRKFEIQDAVLWRVSDEASRVLGLACRVPRWRYVD